MPSERRNTLGSAILTGVVSILIVIIMGFSIKSAGQSMAKAQNNEVDIREVQTIQTIVRDDILEIKTDVKAILGKF